MSGKVKPYYDEPSTAYVMRLLAWETYVANGSKQNKLLDEQVKSAINLSRRELGLSENELSPSNIAGYQKEVREFLDDALHPKDWDGSEWFFMYAPFHRTVRELSTNPVVDGPSGDTFIFTFRDNALPKLKVTVGNNEPKENLFTNPRVIYILRHNEENQEKMYVGLTNDNEKRIQKHNIKKIPHWWFIAQPDDTSNYHEGVQMPTESMTTAFWSEIANVSNDKIPTKTLPSFPQRQQATLLTTAISSAYLYIVGSQKGREALSGIGIKEAHYTIPFKKENKISKYLEPLHF